MLQEKGVSSQGDAPGTDSQDQSQYFLFRKIQDSKIYVQNNQEA